MEEFFKGGRIWPPFFVPKICLKMLKNQGYIKVAQSLPGKIVYIHGIVMKI